jgi:hypothetical protein
VQRPIALKLGCGPLHDFDVLHFEYFREVCAPEFSLFFELALWERIVLEACIEPCIGHAALAIGALTRSHYQPSGSGDASLQVESVTEYSIKQYNLAIQELNSCLDISTRSWELAILGTIVFVAIEVLQGYDNKVQILLCSAFAILKAHPDTATCPESQKDSSDGPSVANVDCPSVVESTFKSSPDFNYLVSALYRIGEQASSFSELKTCTLARLENSSTQANH